MANLTRNMLVVALVDFGYARVAKLINQRKNFIVIAEHEPYFIKVYGMIREQEKKQGSWTDEDERIYQETYVKTLTGA